MSQKSTGFHALCRIYFPFLLRRCPGFNLHYIWDTRCYCCHLMNDYVPVYRWIMGKWREEKDIVLPEVHTHFDV